MATKITLTKGANGQFTILPANKTVAQIYPMNSIYFIPDEVGGTFSIVNASNGSSIFSGKPTSILNGDTGIAFVDLAAVYTYVNTNFFRSAGGSSGISGTGFVKASGTTLSYDNSTYTTIATSIASRIADYTISTDGTTITAVSKAGVVTTNTDAYTIIQACIDALTASTTRGLGGGFIFIGKGTYTLSNELHVLNWENQGNSNPGYSQLVIQGAGKSTKLYQTTSGKNALIFKGNVSVSVTNMRIECTSAARSCLRFDGSGTDEISVFGGYFNDLYMIAASSSYPALYMQNFFDCVFGDITCQNTSYDAIILENASTTTLYGNSHFGFIRAIASSSTPFAGLRIKSTDGAGFHVLDLISFSNYECVSSYYGIYISDGSNNTFSHVDIEYGTIGIHIGGGSYARGNNFYGGLVSVNATTGTDIECTLGGNLFDGLTLGGGTSAKPINDTATGQAPFDPANEYNVGLVNNNAANIIYPSTRDLLTYKYWGDGRTHVNFPDDVTFKGATPIFTALTASQLVATGASKELVNITALPSSTTATTQAVSDTSTKVATTAYLKSVSAYTVLSANAKVDNTGNTTENTVYTGTIPANSIGTNGHFAVVLLLSAAANNANAKTFKVKIGATTIATITGLASNLFSKNYITIHNRNSLSSQVLGDPTSQAQIGLGTSSIAPVTAAINFGTSQTLTITAQNGNSGDTISIEAFHLIANP